MRPEEHVAAITGRTTEPPRAVGTLLVSIRSAGTTTDQAVYEAAYAAVFEHLDVFDAHLATSRYLEEGPQPTDADWWLFAVLVRFDGVYDLFYKLNARPLQSYAQLGPYVRDLFQHPGVAETVDWPTILAHYATESTGTNPKGLVPRGGVPDLRVPHDRWRFDQRVDGGGIEEDPSRPRRPGEWVRPQSGHRDWISADGSTGFAAQPGRYHLYIANNCPWCHRVALVRQLEGLQDVISMDVLFYRRHPERGWQFRPEEPGCTPDTVNGTSYIKELYERLGSAEKSVPVLWDRETGTIVNNESAEIIRMLSGAFADLATTPIDLYPQPLRAEIDHVNRYTYVYVNNGAYKAGFASSQDAHDTWFRNVFAALAWLDRRLDGRRFLVGDQLTEADVRLFPTIYRFDPVYVNRFRLNRRRVADHRHLASWLDRMLDVPGVREASNLEHCKKGYFGRTGNNLVPVGPQV